MSISSESGKDLKTNTLYRYDYSKNAISESKMTIGIYQSTLSSWDYWEKYYDKKYNGGYFDDNEDIEDEDEENFVWEDEEARARLLAEIEEAIMKGEEELASSLQEDLLDLEDEIETRRIERKYGRF